MEYKKITKNIIIFQLPPKPDISNFSTESLKEIAVAKLSEIYIEVKRLERIRKKEIRKYKKYIINKLQLTISEFKYLKSKFYLSRWIKYWSTLAGFNQQENKNSFSKIDVPKLREIPIENLLTIQLRNTGNKLTGPCPFHNTQANKEKSPSFFIYPETNSYHCFSCGAHGAGAIDFLMNLRNIDFVTAIKELNHEV